MKILQIINRDQLRGAEVFACQLSRELRFINEESDVVILFDDGLAHNPGLKVRFSLNFDTIRAVKAMRFYDIPAFKRLSDIVKKGKYDIVQANTGDTLKYSVFSKILFGWDAPIIFRNASLMSSFIKTPIQRRFNKFLLKNCRYIISVSQSCLDDIQPLIRRSKTPSEVIPIGTEVDSSFNLTNEKLERVAEPLFINVGSFVQEKNQLFLIEIFNAFYRKHSKGYLWILGDGPLRKKIESSIHKFGLEDRVKLLGYQNDALKYINTADMLVMPSLIEGLPGVLLEAMACAKPIVCSAVSGMPDVVKNDYSGYCIESFNVNDYTEALEKLSLDDNLRRKLGQNGRRLIQENFRLPQIAERFYRSYKTILNPT